MAKPIDLNKILGRMVGSSQSKRGGRPGSSRAGTSEPSKSNYDELSKDDVFFILHLSYKHNVHLVSLLLHKKMSEQETAKLKSVLQKINHTKDDTKLLNDISKNYPEIACAALFDTRDVGFSKTVRSIVGENYPSIARQAICAAIFPQNHPYQCHALTVIFLPNLVNRAKNNSSKTKEWLILDTALAFLYILKSFYNDRVDECSRFELCKKYEILNMNNQLNEAWMEAFYKAKDYIQNTFDFNIFDEDGCIVLSFGSRTLKVQCSSLDTKIKVIKQKLQYKN